MRAARQMGRPRRAAIGQRPMSGAKRTRGGGGRVVRHRRIAILVLLLTAGVLGGYWCAFGQEMRPWPPPPVRFDPTTAGAPAVPPPVPPSGTMPPAPVDRRENPIRKWVSNFLPGGADTKMRACGVGVPDSVQQVGHQDPAPEIPPPVPDRKSVV